MIEQFKQMISFRIDALIFCMLICFACLYINLWIGIIDNFTKAENYSVFYFITLQIAIVCLAPILLMIFQTTLNKVSLNYKIFEKMNLYKNMLFRKPIVFFAYQENKMQHIIFKNYKNLFLNYSILVSVLFLALKINFRLCVLFGITISLNTLIMKYLSKETKHSKIIRGIDPVYKNRPLLILDIICTIALLFLILSDFLLENNDPTNLIHLTWIGEIAMLSINYIFYFHTKIRKITQQLSEKL
jgi:hypothetical protein